MRDGVGHLVLHQGTAPKWLLELMTWLCRAAVEAAVTDHYVSESIRRRLPWAAEAAGA